MPARIVTVAQQKGGAGKTTLVIQLATALAAAGRRVAVVDIDPQGSLTAWMRLREQRGPSVPELRFSMVGGWRLPVELDRLRGEHDVVVIDSPPHAETDAKVAKLGVYLAYGVTEQAAAAPSSAAGPPLGSPGGTGGSGGYGTSVSPSSSAGFSRYVAQVVLIAADLTQSRATGSVVELWRGNAQTTGPSKDLQALAPLLIEGAFRHFGDTTATTVRHSFGEEEVKKLRETR